MSYQACRSLEEIVRLLPSFVVQKKDFKMGRRIGKGAFSVVYAGIQKSTGRVCALKVLNYKTLKSDRLQLFEREVRALAACHSPFVLRFVGFTTKHPFTIVTEYIPNGCLYDALRPPKGGHVLTGTEKTIIAIGLAVGLRRLHEVGIVHRDMKSLNVLLDNKLRPRICDLGLSRCLLDESPMSGHVGTTNWMAPELFGTRRYDEKVDVYAYAMVLWELLSGHSPFSGKTSEQIENIVRSGGRPVAPGDTPRGLNDVIIACWSSDPQRRPSLDWILAEFSSHRARFRDCDDDAVDAFLHELLLDAPEERECSGDLPEHLKSDGLDGDDEVFPAVGSPTFPADVRAFASKLNIENCNGFFASLRQCFAAELPASHALAILSALVSLFERDRSFVAVFTSYQLHKTLPMHVCQELAWILLHIFAVQPDAVGKQMLRQLCSLAPYMPESVLTILDGYATNEPRPRHVNLAYEGMFTHCDAFLTCQEYIPQLLGYFSKDSEFRAKFAGSIAELFENILHSKLKPAPGVFAAILKLPGLGPIVTRMDFARLLMDPDSYELAVEVCARCEVSFSADVVRALLCNAQTYAPAIEALVAACQSERVAVVTAGLADIWIAVQLPTFANTVRLLAAIVRFPAAARVVAGCGRLPDLFLELLDAGDEDLVRAIGATLKEIPMSRELVASFSRAGFLEDYYRFVMGRLDPALMADVIGLTQAMARVAFVDEYAILVPTLKNLMASDAWRGLALGLLATMSVHEEAKEILRKNQIPGVVAPLRKDAQLGQYARYCLRNVAQ